MTDQVYLNRLQEGGWSEEYRFSAQIETSPRPRARKFWTGHSSNDLTVDVDQGSNKVRVFCE